MHALRRKVGSFRRVVRSWRQQRLIRRFHQLYYYGPSGGDPLHETITWLGTQVVQCPLDAWIYQELIVETRPDVIVETGVLVGGTSLYLASLCDLLGQGEVIGCDITLQHVAERVRRHPRITLLEGSSTDPSIVARIAERCRDRRTMVILDSDHRQAHVVQELRSYAPLVTVGCYLICEDTNVNGHPVWPNCGPGPYEAVQEFLRETSGWVIDRRCERLLVTFHPSGFLRRVA